MQELEVLEAKDLEEKRQEQVRQLRRGMEVAGAMRGLVRGVAPRPHGGSTRFIFPKKAWSLHDP